MTSRDRRVAALAPLLLVVTIALAAWPPTALAGFST